MAKQLRKKSFEHLNTLLQDATRRLRIVTKSLQFCVKCFGAFAAHCLRIATESLKLGVVFRC